MNAAALAKRDAAFAKALQDLTRDRNSVLTAYPLKERARNPAIGNLHEKVCKQAEEDYRAARSIAQAEYLKAIAPAEGEWEAGL